MSSRTATLLCAALLGCGQDASFTKLADPEPPAEDTSVPPVEEEAEAIPEPSPECPDRIFPVQTTTVREDCRVDPPVVRYTPVIEWQTNEWSEFPETHEHNTTPVIGQLTDDNGDGRIDTSDTPDILILSFLLVPEFETSTVLRLLSGDGTEEHWHRFRWEAGGRSLHPLTGGTPAIGDLDADGIPELVLVLGPEPEDDLPATYVTNLTRMSGVKDCFLAVLDPSGELQDINLEHPVTCLPHSPLLADVQGDGEVDIVIGNETFRSGDLAPIGTPYAYGASYVGSAANVSGYWTGSIAVAADLDGDGTMETVTGRHIQEWDGEFRCTTGMADAWPAVADLDGDGDGEVVVSGTYSVVIFDENCNLLNAWPLDTNGRGGPPTIADYDGDGIPEIGFAAASDYVVYEVDGTLKWTSPASDYSSNCTGSSVFDFEEDGYAEVVYADEKDLWIISGHGGDFVMRWAGHSSFTANEYPVVADADGDGEAEIVVVGNHGIAVIAAEEGWAPARQVWNQHAYWITNVNDDLTIPSPTPQNWPEYNSFRSGDLRVNAGQGARLVDARPFVHDICEVECSEGTVQVALSPNNEGLANAIFGIDLAVYAEQTDGSRELLQVLSAEDQHRAGYTTEGVVLELAMADLPTGTLILVADDDGTGNGAINECDETNNELRLEGLCASE